MCNLFKNDETSFNVIRLEDGTLLFKIYVKKFSGEFAYCIEDENLNEYIDSLRNFYSSNVEEVKMMDMDSDSYIKFKKLKYGHIIINGQLGSTFQRNYLMFEFNADQTVIANLIDRLS